MDFLKCTLFLYIFILSVMPFQDAKAQKSPERALSSDLVYGIRFGLLAHDVGGFWSHSRAESGVDINAEIVFKKPRFEIWRGIIQPNLGVSINSQGDTSKAYGGLLGEFLFDNGYFVNSGVGLAVHDGQLESKDSNKKQLGSRVLFRIPIEFGFTISERHRISIMFDHMSNAYLANPNEGMDTVGVRYGFQF
jgi:lipid A 3-O-deacylase